MPGLTFRSALARAAGGVTLSLALGAATHAAGFTFAALGDAPYTADDESRFVSMIAELNREPLAFVVHVGDFKTAITPCTDETFLQRRAWFALSHHPFVFVPGDNEWTDCRRALGAGRDPVERLARLREIFFAGDAGLGQRPLALVQQHAMTRGIHGYPEHLRWEHGGVLFFTLNAPGPDNHSRADPAEHARRSAAARDWIERSFRRARARGATAVVVFLHANPWSAPGRARPGFTDLIAALADEVRAYGGEVLMVHGDTHEYRVDRPMLDPDGRAPLANFTRAEVHGYPTLNWIRVRAFPVDGRMRFEVQPGS